MGNYQNFYISIIGIYLSRQQNTNISQKTSFTGKIEEDDGTTIFLSLKTTKTHSKLLIT